MIQYFGWVAATLFTIASVNQLVKVWRQGHAEGMSWWYLILIWVGFCFMAPYAIVTHAKGALIYSYVLQLIAFTIMIVRKRFPRNDQRVGRLN